MRISVGILPVLPEGRYEATISVDEPVPALAAKRATIVAEQDVRHPPSWLDIGDWAALFLANCAATFGLSVLAGSIVIPPIAKFLIRRIRHKGG